MFAHCGSRGDEEREGGLDLEDSGQGTALLGCMGTLGKSINLTKVRWTRGCPSQNQS